METTKWRVLCVDDEPNVLEGLKLHLRRRYEVFTAPSGAAGLELLAKEPSIAVVMSDMRMPVMDGAAFLKQARQAAPDSTRILLTSQAELESAVAAVNEGQIFRFLTKPCPPPQLLGAVDAAAAHHRLITAERVLLEQTLKGSIQALTDVLAIINPALFGRATRVRALAGQIGTKLAIRELWQVEVAALLSQLGSITLPPETLAKSESGQRLTDEEAKMVARVPAVTDQLLHHIPRLEGVRAMLAAHGKPRRAPAGDNGDARLVDQGAEVLHAALAFDAIEQQSGPTVALEVMRAHAGDYGESVLAALIELRGQQAPRDEVRELSLAMLRVGMILAQDLKMTNGTLLAARGYELSAGFVERARNFWPGSVKEPIRVIIRPA